MDSGSAPPIEYAVAARPFPGESVSGDTHVLKGTSDGVLISVIDGLGHGAEAAKAAEAAAAILEAHAHEAIATLLQRCHAALNRTRGVAMSLASINHIARTMTWSGIGNVEAVLVRAMPTGQRAQDSLLLRNGIVGFQMPTPSASVLSLFAGDTLALATDGIAHGFASDVTADEPPQRIADRILRRYAKDTDDALVLIARWTGQGS